VICLKLIVGLGNPGREYEMTRHNIGFMAIDRIVASLGICFDRNKFNGSYCVTCVNGEKVMFLKPLEYMNLSGNVLGRFVKFFCIDISDILIIHDDLDLDLGRIKLKSHGSSGGHNGLKNIEANLGTQGYKRLKIGISNDKRLDTKDYVLGRFSSSDFEILNPILDKIPLIFNDFLSIGFDLLMNKYN
jgi:PTH1 family peptidyl-tRNA hydrolase